MQGIFKTAGGHTLPGNPSSLNERKQALIRSLRSGRGGGAGGAAKLSGSVPFGAIPRLGFRPDARSVFNRNENFNFSNSPQGQQDAFSAVSAPGLQQQGPENMQQATMAPTGGFGPSAGPGSGSVGTPQGGPSTQGGFGEQTGGSTHLLDSRPLPWNAGQIAKTINRPSGIVPESQFNPTQQGVPGNVAAALQGDGAVSQGVSAWLQANPWYLEQMMSGGGGGGGFSGGGAVL